MKHLTQIVNYILISITIIWIISLVIFSLIGKRISPEELYLEQIRYGLETIVFMVLIIIPLSKYINGGRVAFITSLSIASLFSSYVVLEYLFYNNHYFSVLSLCVVFVLGLLIIFYSLPKVRSLFTTPNIRIIEEMNFSSKLVLFITVFLLILTLFIIISGVINSIFPSVTGKLTEWDEAVYSVTILFALFKILQRKREGIWIIFTTLNILTIHGIFNAIFIPKYCQGVYVIIYGFFSAIAFFYLCSSNSEYWKIDSKNNEV
ncbi:hypothetical protein KAU32_07580 [bacterium]|nr:hypothetical protein [bacterium]